MNRVQSPSLHSQALAFAHRYGGLFLMLAVGTLHAAGSSMPWE